MRCTSENLKLAYVMSKIPAANARLYGVTSVLVAIPSMARNVARLMAGACLGASADSTMAADHTKECASGQSTPRASAQTVRACLADAGTVRPRSVNDSR